MRSFLLLTLFGALSVVRAQNGTCTKLSLGKGPTISPDTASAFSGSKDLAALANDAPTPANYTQSFKNLNASSSADNYLGYIELESYDTNACASNCTIQDDCQSVNIFFERNPTLEVGTDCPNPPSTTTIKCAFWGSGVEKKNTNNEGYQNKAFVIAVAGSNGYFNEKAGKVEMYVVLRKSLVDRHGITNFANINPQFLSNGGIDTQRGVDICSATCCYAREYLTAGLKCMFYGFRFHEERSVRDMWAYRHAFVCTPDHFNLSERLVTSSEIDVVCEALELDFPTACYGSSL